MELLSKQLAAALHMNLCNCAKSISNNFGKTIQAGDGSIKIDAHCRGPNDEKVSFGVGEMKIKWIKSNDGCLSGKENGITQITCPGGAAAGISCAAGTTKTVVNGYEDCIPK